MTFSIFSQRMCFMMNLTLNSLVKPLRQILTVLLVVMTAMIMMSRLAYAGELETKPISGVTTTQFQSGYITDDSGINQPNIPSVSVDQAADFLSGKMYDIIMFFQVIAKPLCILVGVASAMISLLGIFGDSGMLYKGITGMVLAAICYFGIMYAPELIAFINGWMSEGTETLLNQTL